MNRNRLAGETSPYLRQHKDNPVHWYPWGPEALAEARAQDKPILLSVGYAACHWCHVMAHESFEDPGIAAQMNADFINIKVDREQRPDLDAIYQSALALMGGQGGWPLTMFLTPASEPFYGGTYFPNPPRYGRPGFDRVLGWVAEAYRSRADDVAKTTAQLRQALLQTIAPSSGPGLTRQTVLAAAGKAQQMLDRINGGTMGAPKFPQPAFFGFLWRAAQAARDAEAMAAVTLTLDRMSLGGIYDHLGGGYARYSTDEVWLAPHFEKMLYDNALISEWLCDAYNGNPQPLYGQRVRETLDWALREMRINDPDAGPGTGPGTGPDGPFAFAAALDADSEGVEGKFYVWPEAEIDALLGPDAAPFKQAYDVTPQGNWEGHTILNRSASGAAGDGPLEAGLGLSRAILLAAREGRPRPLRDHKVLADWNAMMVVAFCRAAATFGRPDWLAVARRLFDFVRRHLQTDGRLRHCWCDGRLDSASMLDDLAHMARAALCLFSHSGEAAYLALAETWMADAQRHHWDAGGGGYFLSPDDADDVILRTKPVTDTALPAANGVMAENLVRLHLMTGDASYRDRTETLFRLIPAGADHMAAHASLLSAFLLAERPVQIVLAGFDQAAERSASLLRAAHSSPIIDPIVLPVPAGQTIAAGHPAAGKTAIGGKPTAYVCVGPVCEPPLTDAAALSARLAALSWGR